MPTSDPTHDVIIAGAGPVGLLLACELRLAGASVLVLERDADARSPLKSRPLGVRGLSVASQEALDRRDLLPPLRERALEADAPEAAHVTRQPHRPAGHFAGIQFFLDKVDATRWPYRVDAPQGPLVTDIASLEAVLTARAESLGVEVRHGWAVEVVEADAAGVRVQAGDGREASAGWLVGCDGARSRVRRAAGIGFAGTEPEFTGYSAVVELADPQALPPGRRYTPAGMYMFNAPGLLAMADFDGGAFHRTAPVTREHVQAVLRRISGVEVEVRRLDLATTWTDRAYLAAGYRTGRVLLAGDAAHIHAPLGGQGLNLGLGDAMDLGWKLAAVARGDAPEALLDTYEPERRPVAEGVLQWSRAQVALMRPDPGPRALAAMLGELVETVDAATWFAGRVWGVDIRYDLGDAHPIVGRSAPDLRFADGSRLNAHLRDGRGLLVALGDSPVAPVAGDRLRALRAEAQDALGLGALLVRPDGIVAWACDCGGDGAGLGEAVARWFG